MLSLNYYYFPCPWTLLCPSAFLVHAQGLCIPGNGTPLGGFGSSGAGATEPTLPVGPGKAASPLWPQFPHLLIWDLESLFFSAHRVGGCEN